MTDVLPTADFLSLAAPRRHARYRQFHATGDGVHRVVLQSGDVGWLVTGYDAVRQALTDPRLAGRTGAVGNRRALPAALTAGMNSHMLNVEPPDHTRLRRLISAAFTRRRMEQMRPRVQQITDELLDAIGDAAQVDIVTALATPLPIRVLTELIGVPDDKIEAFHSWTTTLTASGLALETLESAAGQMLDYTRTLLAAKRRQPRPDLLSALVAVRDGQDRLTEDELTSMVFLLLIAGQETTVNLIGNTLVTLLTNPTQLRRLRAEPDLVESTVEEILRYESPVQAALRYAAEPVELAGARIPAGAVVVVSLLGANRDPARFAEPSELDVARADNPHVAFGYGIHHCLGAPLARMEGAIALGSLLRRYPAIRLAAAHDDVRWRVSLVMHGLETLPVQLRPGAGTGE